MHTQLVEAGIDATLVLDSAVGHIMEQIDFVMLGAEGVTENGGIINKVIFHYWHRLAAGSAVLKALLRKR